MKHLLLPHKCKALGWILLIPAVIFGIFLMSSGFELFELNAPVFAVYSDRLLGDRTFFEVIEANLANTLAGVWFITGALLVAFSKEKHEDEYIARLRLNALLWAVLINYILLILAFLFVYGLGFLTVMVYNMFTVLIIFIARFHYLLFKNSNYLPDEKQD